MKDSKYARVTITIPEHLLEWIDRKAAKDDRPRSYIMAKMVEKIAKEVEAQQSAAPLKSVPDSAKTPQPKRA
jgi:metal-responsive CopG/Arc/MetJ family transcriptional regulator